jgi:protein-L-isoaspartate(D-aspartate) O-methyltransferase
MSASGIFRHIPLLLCALVLLVSSKAHAEDKYARARLEMVRTIAADVRSTSRYISQRTLDRRVMDALGKVPRHEFVPEHTRNQAYENRPLPIGYGQTISQPYIVAVMTNLLRAGKDSRVLEIGTGSGYQAAILAELVGQVYTIEIVEPLYNEATARLRRLGYDNIETLHGDGYYGWEEHAPFDAIVVTAAASHIPPPLLGQLKNGGRMVIPVGSAFMVQQLVLVEKTQLGEFTTRQLLPVRFVPLTGEH